MPDSVNSSVFEYPARDVSWLARDVLIFNISVGATVDEPHFLYELHPAFQVLPTFFTVLTYKGIDQDVIDFRTQSNPTQISGVRGMPEFDITRIVDGQKRIKILRPLPTSSAGRKFAMRQRVLGVYDKGRPGTVIETETDLTDEATGEVYATIIGSVFAVGQGNWGGPKGPTAANFPVPKGRDPDHTHTQQTTRETPLLYRLNGDYNPLHAEPGLGQKMGFGGAILHGLCTWNLAAHALLRTVGGSQSSNMKDFQARFVAPVVPGDTLFTQIWATKERNEKGFEDFRFQVITQRGNIVLGNGRASVKPVLAESKL